MARLCCMRCGDVLIERHSTLEVSGDLRNWIRSPLVICQECAGLFRDWLRSGPAAAEALPPRRPSPGGGLARPAVKRLPSGLSNPPATPAAIA